MKTKYIKIIAFLVALFSTSALKSPVFSQVTAEDPTGLTQEFTINIDKLGNAKMELDENMNATQWANFKQSQVYNDPSLTKRDLERSYSTYDVQDFKRDLDEMNRAVKLSMTINSYAQYKGNGHWTLRIDAKDPKVTKLSDRAYMITGNALLGSILTQQIFKIYFPPNAKKVTQTTDEFGKAIFTYNDGGGILSYMKWNNIVGVLLILAALYLFVKSQANQKYNTVKA